MWIIKGPFSQENDGTSSRKILLPATEYILGRGKEATILIPLKSFSSQHARIHVGDHSFDDATKIDSIPRLTYHHVSIKKTAALFRGEAEQMLITASGAPVVELQSGDRIHPTGGEYAISFHWVPINVFMSSRGGMSGDQRTKLSKDLARIGIKSIRAWSPSVTHLVFQSVQPPSFRILSALVTNSRIVSPDWVNRIIRELDGRNGVAIDIPNSTIANDHNGAARGRVELPKLLANDLSNIIDEGKFRPSGADGKGWSPNPARTNLFDGLRFCIFTTSEAPTELLDVIRNGGGEFRALVLNADEGQTRAGWVAKLRALRRKSDKNNERTGMLSGLVLLGDSEALGSELGSQWNDIYVKGTKSQEMRIVWVSELTDCVLNNDLSFIDCGKSGALSKPDTSPTLDMQGEAVPGPSLQRRATRASSRQPSEPPTSHSIARPTYPNEPPLPTSDLRGTPPISQVEPAPKLTRRVTRAKTPSAHQVTDLAEEVPIKVVMELEPEPQKLTLKRRVTSRKKDASPGPAVVSRAPSLSVDISSTPPDPESASVIPLKRRVTGRAAAHKPAAQSQLPESEDIFPVEAEPAHKKYKSLFEGTQGPLLSIPEDSDRQTPRASLFPSEMDVDGVPETSSYQRGNTQSKRKVDLLGEPDNSTPPPSKRRATPSRVSVEPPDNIAPNKGQSQTVDTQTHTVKMSGKLATMTNSPPVVKVPKSRPAESPVPFGIKENAPDTEPAFLQALASRTKTKSKEDAFDREFNQLRISVPDKEKEELEEKRKKELEVWNEIDHDMDVRGNFMVVEYVDYRKKAQGRNEAKSIAYDGNVPNFKKFKKKQGAGRSGTKVELVLTETVDFGMGDAYWQRDPNVTLGGDPNGGAAIPSLPTQSQAIGSPIRAPPPPKKRRVDLQVHSTDEATSENESEEEVILRKPKGKAPTMPARMARGKSATTSVQDGRTTPTRSVAKSTFDDDDDEEEPSPEDESEIFDMDVSGVGDDDEFTSTFKSTATTGSRKKNESLSRPTRQTRRTPVVTKPSVVMEDSDSDGVTFKGFGKRSKGVR